MRFLSLPWSLQALVYASIATADSLPYNPTRILSVANSSYIYLFQPSSQSANQGLLRAIDITKQFETNQLAISTITTSLPFLQDDSLVPYTAAIDASGNITIIAGSCTAGANKTEVWRYWPGPANTLGQGAWSQHDTSDQDVAPGSNLTGSNYLANAVAFSSRAGNNATDISFYLFGGMCPFTESDAGNWISDAAYSSMMLQLAPDYSKGASAAYDVSSVASRGSAIAEAGFSMTGLTPTFSVNASGEPSSQQQDFVLIGGHTQQAFINMSNIALFSLPQESWAYIPVKQPSSLKTDLAVRQSSGDVEPRSGHSAVLSEDGTSIIVFGGWVGDVNNAAEPQVAVLHLGSEYGGSASLEWTWTFPKTGGNSTPAGSGLYGHGATMLPGGVMLVAGGYTISQSSSKRSTQTTSDRVYLFNTTSNTWIDSYTPPANAKGSADSSSSGPLSKTSQQAGLGVGLVAGAVALIGLVCFYFWYSKRLRKQREERERELLTGSDPSDMTFSQRDRPFMSNGGHDGRGNYAYGQYPSPGMSQAGSTGIFVNMPSPTRGLRQGMTKSYSYHQAPRYDDHRMIRGSGQIHPILESADEESIRGDDNHIEESEAVQRLRQVELALGRKPQEQEPEENLRELQRILKASDAVGSRPLSDPFADPEPNPLGSHPVSPEILDTTGRAPSGIGRADSPTRGVLSAEMDGSINWMIVDREVDLSDPSSSSQGRMSPTRTDERTSSTLSEQSHLSNNSITRTMSTQTGALLSAALALRRDADNDSLPRSPNEERTSTMGTASTAGGRQSPYYFYGTHRPTNDAKQKHRESFHAPQKSAESFATAKSNFAHLQDEGAALLGGRPAADRDDPYQRAMAATSSGTVLRNSAIPPPLVIPHRKRQGWVGSLKRALTGMSNDRAFSFTSNAVEKLDIPKEAAESRTSSSSPIRARKPVPNTNSEAHGPRRAVSDGGTLLQQKRGQHDWEQNKEFSPYRDDPDPGDWGNRRRTSSDEKAAENEWDVEGAAGQRDVQVMFTVPKARLRVVNADIERASLRSASDSVISRTGSLLGREESVRSGGSRGSRSGREREREREGGKRGGVLGFMREEEEEKGVGSSTAREVM